MEALGLRVNLSASYLSAVSGKHLSTGSEPGIYCHVVIGDVGDAGQRSPDWECSEAELEDSGLWSLDPPDAGPVGRIGAWILWTGEAAIAGGQASSTVWIQGKI